jgi:transposase
MDDGTVWVGLDLGLRETHVCVIGADGDPLHEQSCETALAALNDALAQFPLGRIGAIAVEAGSDTHIVRKLRSAGFPVAIFEARKASKFLALRRNKTDASDARGLADLARLGRNTVSQVYLKSPECQQLRGLLVMRKRLVIMRLAAESLLRSRLGQHGRRLKAGSAPGSLRKRLEIELAQLSANDGVDLRQELAPLAEVCESLRTYLRTLDRDLEKRASAHEVCRRLMEVPGVGAICALSFYSAIEDPHRFSVNQGVGAYLGLSPRRYQSGATARTRGITKSGSKMTRSHLVIAATVFGTCAPDCRLKQWYLALRERSGPGRARVALARKLAIMLLAMWKNGTHFELLPGNGHAEADVRQAVEAAG